MMRASGEAAARAASRLIGARSSRTVGMCRALVADTYIAANPLTGERARIVATFPKEPMATTEEKLIEEAVSLLSPLASTALEAVVDVVRMLVNHKDGVELAARREAEALAAQAFIRS